MVCRHEIGFELTNLVKTGEVSNWLYTHKNMRARYIYPTCKITKAGARDLRVQRTPRNKRQKAREPAEEREDKRDRCFAEEQGKKEADMKNKRCGKYSAAHQNQAPHRMHTEDHSGSISCAFISCAFI
ncbi:hypothetical protein CNBN2250 [Cryptococcus deneoformans B-3501A]|uniref:hypothetical protein n=1 Tax=Cryptococcus deneoformans (strain B-3501A) TaxID=283643 RepID=UPI000042E402|nr:hypothetical protein CNBN2250 [Cryptococcus neoformans var. neoformans B-3501A]EAL17133.1 hypothetical protein CNBN2250 [Cryptococcus neoformans var. neoformans B-3501A]